METETLQSCAYHESGRVVFAYLNGFACDAMELSATDSGSGRSRLNGGQDIDFINAIFSGKPQSVTSEKSGKAIEVAEKLIKIYCAGSCAESYFMNGKQENALAELEIPGQDIRYIELIQQFLKHHVPNHPENYPAKVIAGIFTELKKPDVWKPIETLAEAILNKEDKTLNRFYIEDSLMKAGFQIKRQRTFSGVGLQESDERASSPSVTVSEPEQTVNIDKVLRDFLKIVRTEWREDEMEAAVKYLKGVFRKYG